MKFKVGDIVRFKSEDSSNAEYFESGLENLEIKEVREDVNNYRVYESDKSDVWTVREDELELMEAAERKFKVGDRVRYKGTKRGSSNGGWEAYFGRHGVKKGDIGVISRIDYDGDIFVKDDIRPNTKGYLRPEDLEFYDEQTIKMDIKDFPKDVLKEAETKALEEIKNEQIERAKSEFKRMHEKIKEAEKRKQAAEDELVEFKAQLKALK